MDEDHKDHEGRVTPEEKPKEGSASSSFIEVTVRTRLKQDEHGGYEADSADVEVKTPALNGDQGEGEVREAEAGEVGEEVSVKERLLEISGQFAEGEIDETALLGGVAEVLGKSREEVETAIQERVEKQGFGGFDEWRETILAGEVSELAALMPDGPAKDAVMKELGEGEVEGEIAGGAEEKPPSEVETQQVEEEAETDGEEIDKGEVTRKAQWVYETAKAYGRGQMPQSEFDEGLAGIIAKQESPTGEQIQEARDGAEEKLREVGISSFTELQSRLHTPRLGVLRKNDYIPLVGFVAESPAEHRLIKKAVDKMVNKDIRKRVYLWLAYEILAGMGNEMKGLYEKVKKGLYQAAMEDVQRGAA